MMQNYDESEGESLRISPFVIVKSEERREKREERREKREEWE